MTGAMFGGMIGSSIGGISGGWRGHDVGTLVGMAVGAGTGAAIGAAAESKERESIREHYRSLGIDNDADYGYEETPRTVGRTSAVPNTDDDDVYGVGSSKPDNNSGYSSKPIYDDRIEMDANPLGKPSQQAGANVSQSGSQSNNGNVPPAVVEVSETGTVISTPIQIENARFINNDNTVHIAKGELVKISFEVRNMSNKNLYGIVPTVKETMGNKHLYISPATMIENLGARKAIRYTAYVSAEKSLKKGTAHFTITVESAGKQLSNVIEFDVPLN